jgi:hypothetical protein
MNRTHRISVALASLGAASLLACRAAGSRDDKGLRVEPPAVDAWPGRSVKFSAVGQAASGGVIWAVREASGGSVDGTGLYTAPGAPGTFHVVATSVDSPDVSGSASVMVEDPAVTIIPSSRRTTWDPGIPGGIPDSSAFTVHTTLQAADYGNGAADASAAINAAVNAAGQAASAASPRVVQLSAGTFQIAGELHLGRDHVVLRGAGPDVPPGTGTRLVRSGSGPMFFMGNYVDWWAAAKDVVGGISKGASSFTLAPGHGVQVGDLLVLDMLDDASVIRGDGNWWKRAPGDADNGPPSSGGYRSVGQTVEVTGVSGDLVTIAGIVHHEMPAARSPQVFGNGSRRGGYAGIGLEGLTLTGVNNDYGVAMWNTRRSWIKNVEFDGRPASQGGSGPGSEGTDLRIFRGVRNMVEHCYLHHSRSYITDNHAYSISIAMQSSDNLVWDNIIWFKNKNLVMEASGPGNVVAYNYLEDPAIADSPGVLPRNDWADMCLDATHLSSPGLDLFEGNYTAKMGGADTHGGATAQTFFRNFSAGDRLYPLVENSSNASIILQQWMHDMNVVGNVLHTRTGVANRIYEPTVLPNGTITFQDSEAWKIWRLGFEEGEWTGPIPDPEVAASLLRIGNYDNVRNQIDLAPAVALPDSLFLASKPAFFGALPWPPVDPSGASAGARVGTLPAKARFDDGSFF